MKKIVLVTLSFLALAGCAHKSTVATVSATNIYSSHDEKIAGNFTYDVDSTSLTKLKKDNSIQGFQCAAHKFPIDASDAFKSSLPSMLEQVFENIEAKNGSPVKGIPNIVFRVERFDATLRVIPGFWSADANANVEMAISATINSDSGKIFSTMVDSSRTKTTDAGGFCEGGSQALAEAARDTIKDVLEKMGERMANAAKLRKEVAAK